MERFIAASSRRLSTLRALPVRRNGWVCQSCRAHQGGTRMRFSTGTRLSQQQQEQEQEQQQQQQQKRQQQQQQQDDKPYYVTTPIFYVNASPHVGHLYSMVVADVLKRWEVLKGREAFLSTGTDEHGMKVQHAAELQGVHPKALCDGNAETFKDLAKKANIANDRFIRTTDPDHREAVEYFWARLRDGGYIYENKHQGWYCVSDETFYPENMVGNLRSPTTGKSFLASLETGNAVEWTEEKNYHFRLTAFRDRLLQFYKDHPNWVVPRQRFTEVINWVENNLEDLSISRPSSRLDWGIPVPDDPSQTIYVWLDALVNYITTTGYPVWQPGSEHKRGWPADVHVVGKDIIRFHCIYWPAFLMALDLPLPKQVLSHGHWLMSKQKMSKSVGNVVDPFFALDRWGVDTMRYFLISNGHVAQDAEYGNAFVVEKYKKALQGGLGNMLNRVTRPKNWNLRHAVETMTKTKAPSIQPLPEDRDASVIQAHQTYLGQVVKMADDQMKALNPSWALRAIMEAVFETNRFFSEVAPWQKSSEGDTATVEQTVFLAGESLRIVGILLQPFIPEKASELLDRLGVKPDRRTFSDAVLYADDSYGTPLMDLGTGANTSLFPLLPVED
ncbi:tRNA synthetases class I (M)-domain-containing protein [Hypoxylon argillaceum]|nr:tRNA synthetases class I (M)-domain-containing protein [Hypoxylon argillaceum]